ncbi:MULTISPECIES: dihydrolipoamide acetyltransferase family protein [unclassified Streptomyces]|uniref:dihydrolipoamide acetyltransferase family protein n=1 Tax=unclassified Streptomyces TaxID=2593676 RepID=UPI002E352D4E|nr:dihydrolipoamide acetyltransferase family protein [Streptomyces sp. NBC_01280]WSE12251.1 2-oxo acid dehydrogenase subunit E2 [Streptomyces sp. NBC_01397]WSE19378.1 2-oxo acid dehydrogenase subunit E2 [Streptomyces sp. NBC_01397]
MLVTKHFRLPDVGEGLTEAEILDWRVGPGDRVGVNDIIVEIETAKAAVELPSPYTGTVTEVLCAEGEEVAVGAPIIAIAVEDDGGPEAGPEPDVTAQQPAESQEKDEPASVPAREPVLVGYGPAHAQTERRPRKTKPEPPAVAPSTQTFLATPPVRKLARDLGVDLHQVTATGPSGRITREDIHHAVEQRATAPNTPDVPREDVMRTPIRGVRKHVAEAMVESAFTAPHATEWVTVDVTRSLRLLERARADKAFTGVRLTPLCLVIKAALTAIARHPEINAKWDAAGGEIVQYSDINLGIAAATPRGLIVPNIAAAQRLSLREIALALTDLIDQARAGRTPPERMRNGTFTITNIGVFGIDGGTPILNPGEAAILCFGQVRRTPWEHKGRVRLRDTTTLAMSFDHRLVDGELGSLVLRDIARFLERPDLMVLHH